MLTLIIHLFASFDAIRLIQLCALLQELRAAISRNATYILNICSRPFESELDFSSSQFHSVTEITHNYLLAK